MEEWLKLRVAHFMDTRVDYARPVFVVTAPINAPGRFVAPLRHVGPVKSGSLREVKPS